jgi:hypothetical protein
VPDPTQGVEKGVENIGEHFINLSQKSWIQQLIRSMTLEGFSFLGKLKTPFWRVYPCQSLGTVQKFLPWGSSWGNACSELLMVGVRKTLTSTTGDEHMDSWTSMGIASQ